VFEGKVIREAHMFRPTSVIAAAWLAALAPAAAQNAPAALAGVDPAAIEELVVANRILAERGIIDAYGHVSVRHPANPNRYLMARALAPALVTAADIMEFDLDSNPVDRRGRSMFTERYIHGEAYKLRPDVNAVVHTHSMGVIPFGVTQVPLRPVIHSASFLHVGVPVWEIREAGGVTNMLVGTAALGKSLATSLGDKPVALMRGHGNVVVGPNLRVAVARAVFTDENARMQSTALAMGGPINYISPEEGAKRDREPGDPSRAWELWKALAMKKMPAN
jgi:ribulose-5-phosphate 4-epimerase/fuculose-1-phosphate aldolase